MQDRSDVELLREYTAQASEAAFREIVTRHADLVYASALRQVRSPELAQDIAQTVFTDLVRKAPALGQTLSENASLVGWLYRSTRFAAHTRLRDDRRRQARERQAMDNFDPTSETATAWDRVGPVLDEAMTDLSDEDREALLLRFFKNHDFRTIGLSLGVSDDAAQKRVSRALERLRAEFHRRGVTTTALALSTAVSANAVSAAPAELAATISTAALMGTTIAATATATVIKTIAMTTLQKTVITGTIAVAVGAAIYEAHLNSRLHDQVQALQQQQADQLQDFQQRLDDVTNRLALLTVPPQDTTSQPDTRSTSPQAIAAISNELSVAREKLTELRGSYSDQHPNVQEQLRAIESLERSAATPGETLELAKGRADLARLQVHYGPQHPDLQAQLRAVESLDRSAAANEPSELAQAKAQLERLRVHYADTHAEVQSQLRRIADLETQ